MNKEILTLDDLIKCYHSEHSIVYKANPGNAGDGVIASATYDFFERNNITFSQYARHHSYHNSRDVLFFGGGGNLIEGLYSEGKDFLESQLDNFFKIIIMPSTIKGYKKFFSDNKNKLIVFCREATTLEYVLSLGYEKGVNVFVSDDMAFYLDLEKYRSNIFSDKNIANCYRTDSESLNGNIEVINHDISLTWNGDYWDNISLARNSTRCMINFLEDFKEVNTDRLHVAILASLLGKIVNFYPNSYYKNQAVFNYSIINRYPKTVFIASPA
ncbi:polysaccharide pyruvyl transferase family protein [Erwinia piriflorinigrans]|uniref:Polysaccharide pyruvyl transferase domain-containing protein n=1 Tax=Erwinia piriflorinigrans CFBP 5888 TaxID=1161919 RepID=V5Z6T0_9GAMM|nr:polysaccharide pyruvyl transferase family protein [Erwinia piriflorinigrans]CCG86689.1 hypothetical protein EPIR_1324 [Erwinia piriflorinigrans CFBP 5888]